MTLYYTNCPGWLQPSHYKIMWETTNKTKWINEIIPDIVRTITTHKFLFTLCDSVCMCVSVSVSVEWLSYLPLCMITGSQCNHMPNQMNLNNKDPPRNEMCHPESDVRFIQTQALSTIEMCAFCVSLCIYKVRLQCWCAYRTAVAIYLLTLHSSAPCDCDSFFFLVRREWRVESLLFLWLVWSVFNISI